MYICAIESTLGINQQPALVLFCAYTAHVTIQWFLDKSRDCNNYAFSNKIILTVTVHKLLCVLSTVNNT